jgi:hypothetical protein
MQITHFILAVWGILDGLFIDNITYNNMDNTNILIVEQLNKICSNMAQYLRNMAPGEYSAGQIVKALGDKREPARYADEHNTEMVTLHAEQFTMSIPEDYCFDYLAKFEKLAGVKLHDVAKFAVGDLDADGDLIYRASCNIPKGAKDLAKLADNDLQDYPATCKILIDINKGYIWATDRKHLGIYPLSH